MSVDTVTGEVIDEMPPAAHQDDSEQTGTDLVHAPQGQPLGLFGRVEPEQAISIVEQHATVLKKFVHDHDLVLEMEDGDWLELPAWNALGTFVGVFAVVDPDSVQPIENGWRASARALTRAGEVVGAAVGLCTRKEKGRKYADDHDLAAMAQSRARRNALRSALSIIVDAAGFETVPPEEKPHSPRQRGKLFALLNDLAKVDPKDGVSVKDRAAQLKEWATEKTLSRFGKRISELNRGEMALVIDWVEDIVNNKTEESSGGGVFEPDEAAIDEAQRLEF